MNNVSWADMQVLAAFLDSRSLSDAARRLGVSQPTVGRRLRALEDSLGVALVEITPAGAAPTAQALAMIDDLHEMTRAAGAVARRPRAQAEPEIVRVACGPWLGGLLAREIPRLTGAPADLRIELAADVAFADLPRREADIAVRNRRPEGGRLVMRRLPDYACAVFGARSLVANRPDAFDERRFQNFDWAALDPEQSQFPTARWLDARLQAAPVVFCSSSLHLLDAIRGGGVLAVTPCFAAEREPAIVRVSAPFIPDYDGHWLVLADDVRRRPHVRRAADRIVGLLGDLGDELRPEGEPAGQS